MTIQIPATSTTFSSSRYSRPNTMTGSNATKNSSSNTPSKGGDREQLLSEVERILSKKAPSRQSLITLLQLCSKNTKDTKSTSTTDSASINLQSLVSREKAFRNVKAKLHPDKFPPAQATRATHVFQQLQDYYVQCCHAMADEGRNYNLSSSSSSSSSSGSCREYRRYSSMGTTGSNKATRHKNYARRSTFYDERHRSDSPNSVLQPLEFDAFSKWPWLSRIVRDDVPLGQSNSGSSSTYVQYAMAYLALNYRGAIVHGQEIDCTYQVPTSFIDNNSNNKTLDQIWDEAGFGLETGGCQRISTASSSSSTTMSLVDQIKHQIWHHGPVVSTSFTLDASFYASTRYAGNFAPSLIGQTHPLLIVGWTMAPHGQVWLVQALRGAVFPIGFGQFHIEDECHAPAATQLQGKAWQSPGPFWDVADMSDKVPVWKEHFESPNTSPLTTGAGFLEIMPLTSDDIENLADLFSVVGFHTMIAERRTFVLRDQHKLAHSRRVILRDVGRVDYQGKRVWKATVSVVRK